MNDSKSLTTGERCCRTYMVQVCVDCMEKGLVITNDMETNKASFYSSVSAYVNCRVLLSNVAEHTWYKFKLTAWTME